MRTRAGWGRYLVVGLVGAFGLFVAFDLATHAGDETTTASPQAVSTVVLNEALAGASGAGPAARSDHAAGQPSSAPRIGQGSSPSPKANASGQGKGTLGPQGGQAELSGVASPGSYLLGPWQDYELRYDACYRVPAGIRGEVTLSLPLVTSDGQRQQVAERKVVPPPDRTYEDGYGNTMADVRFRDVQGGHQVRVTVQARVRTRLLYTQLEAAGVGGAASPSSQGLSASVSSGRSASAASGRPPSAASMRPAAVQAALRDCEAFPSHDAQLQAQARTLSESESASTFVLLRIYDFVRGLNFVEAKEPRTVVAALSSRQVQCSDAAALMTTLCRAAHLPCRYVGGVFAFDEPTSSDATHAWAEAWVDGCGWVPCDPTMGRFDDNVRLSRFGQLLPAYLTVWRGEPGAFQAHVQVSPDSPQAATPDPRALQVSSQARLHRVRASKSHPSTMASTESVALPECLSPALPSLASPTSIQPNGSRSTASPARPASASPQSLVAPSLVALQPPYSKAWQAVRSRLEQQGTPANRLALAAECLRLRRTSEGLRLLSEVLATDPQAAAAWGMLRDAYVALDLWPGVVRVAEAAQQQFPHDASWALVLGQAALRAHDAPRALGAFAEVVRAQPKDGWSHAMLGQAFEEAGDLAGAKREIRRGLQLGIEGSERDFFAKRLEALR